MKFVWQAAEEGKFWEYHDLLFEKSPRQAPDDLKQYAKDLTLDSATFAQCLDSGKQEAAVNRDVQDGARHRPQRDQKAGA